MTGIEDQIKTYLDKVAGIIEKDLQRDFPNLGFRFTHDEYSIYKRVLKIQEACPMVYYEPVQNMLELSQASSLLIIASVFALGRNQTVQVKCNVSKQGKRTRLRIVSESVDILDTDYYPNEIEKEEKKHKKKLIHFFPWFKDYQGFIGTLIVAATDIALHFL